MTTNETEELLTRIAGKGYNIKIEHDYRNHTYIHTVRCLQYPGIVSTSTDLGKAIDNVINAVQAKVSESQQQ